MFKQLLQNKIVKNAGWIIGCKIIKAFLTLVVTAISARYLGPGDYGLLNYAASVVTFVAPLMKLGLDSTEVKEIVGRPDDEGKVVGTTIYLNFFSSLLCMIGVFAFVSIANRNEPETIVVTMIYSLLLMFQAFEMIQYWFHAKFMAKYISMAMLFSYIVVAAAQITVLLCGLGVYWYALANSTDYLLIAVLLIFIYKKKGGQKLRFSKKLALEMLSVSKYYILSGIMITVFAQTDKIMIKLMLGNDETGFYSAAVTCAGMTSFIFAAIIDSMRPAIFEQKNVDDNEFRKKLKTLYSVVIYLSLLQSLVMTIAAPLIIRILYGSDFINAASPLRIIVWYTTFSYLGTIRDIWIIAENKQKYIVAINACGAVFNVILNFPLIHVLGINGAAIASLLTQIFTNVIVGFIFKPIRPNNRIMMESLSLKYLKKRTEENVNDETDKKED